MTAIVERIGTSETIETIESTLPPARCQPLAAHDRFPLPMSYRERFLAEQLLGKDDVYMAVLSRTKVDVGAWLFRGRLWVFALHDEIALVACGSCGRRWYARRIPHARLRESQYNHVTGQLALAPEGPLPFTGIGMPPLDGYQLLAQIYRKT